MTVFINVKDNVQEHYSILIKYGSALFYDFDKLLNVILLQMVRLLRLSDSCLKNEIQRHFCCYTTACCAWRTRVSHCNAITPLRKLAKTL